MSLPKEPRQKMINIMYLVLTAILALNVSSEILNAFRTIEESFVRSNSGLESRTTKLINAFDEPSIIKQFGDKVAKWKPKAEEVKKLSEALYVQIESYKAEIKKESGQKTPGGEFKEDDLEAATRMFVADEKNEKVKAKGEELYNALIKYKQDLGKIDPEIEKLVPSLPVNVSVPKLQNKDNQAIVDRMTPPNQWSYVYFHMTPTIAGLAILSKFQNDIRNSETQLIEYCYSKVTSVELSTSLAAFANASSTMVMAGDELVITAGLGAYNKDTKPNITVDGASVQLNADGQGVYKTIASTPGDFTKKVNISYKDPSSGEQKTTSTEVKYKVGIPTGINVSADATRYFYAGGTAAPNPITISGAVGGAGAINITPVSGIASVVKTGAGTYNIICNTPGMAVFNVADGKSTQKLTIKVKALPDPQNAYVYGSFDPNVGIGGQVIANEFKLQTGLRAVLPNDFEFKGVTYKPKSFTMRFSGKGFNGTETVSCSSFAGASALLNKCVQGSTVQIMDIVMEDNVSGEHKLKQTIGFYLK